MGPVEEAVRRDLMQLPQQMQNGGVAAVALYAASVLDAGGLAPRDAAGFAREVRLALDQLARQAPGEARGDVTDEVRARRERRLAAQEGKA